MTEYRYFRFDRKGDGFAGNVAWMRTSPSDGTLPLRHRGDVCIYCKGPLAESPIPHGTLEGFSIVRCEACDVWMNYESKI